MKHQQCVPPAGGVRRSVCFLLLVTQVPMFSASGLRVAYLKILERKMGSAYKVDKWVRKVVRSGDYLIRT